MLASLPDTVFIAMKQQAADSGLTRSFCGETESESVWTYYRLERGKEGRQAGRLRL